MDGLSIFWTQTALKQRNHVFEYWNGRNKSNTYSRKLNKAILARLELLKSYPQLGTKTNFGTTRAVILGHYSILYKLEKPKIIITGFWDNRQDPKKLVSLLKINL